MSSTSPLSSPPSRFLPASALTPGLAEAGSAPAGRRRPRGTEGEEDALEGSRRRPSSPASSASSTQSAAASLEAPATPAAPTAPAVAGGAPPDGPRGTHAHRHHHGHAHGGMSTFIMDIDEIMAFAAPRFTAALERPAVGMSRGAAAAVNKVAGRTLVGSGKAAQAGAALAVGGGIGVVAGGIYYACVATQEAREGMVEAQTQHQAWHKVLASDGQGVRRLGQVAKLTPAAQERLTDVAEAQAQRHQINVVGKAAAVVGSALMAATLVFSGEFVVSWALPAVVELGHLCMHVAIPAMALYGLLSAYNATRAAIALLAERSAIRRHADKQSAELADALAPHLARTKRGLVYEAATAVGGVGLAVGLVLQMSWALTGLALLAAGTFSLEGFTFARNVTLGAIAPHALRRGGRSNLLNRSVAALLGQMDQVQAAERALASQRPGRMASLRGLWLWLRGDTSAAALQQRLAATFAALDPHQQALLPQGGRSVPLGGGGSARLPEPGDMPFVADPAYKQADGEASCDVLTAMHQLDLLAPLSERLADQKALATLAASCGHVHDGDGAEKVHNGYRRWFAGLAQSELSEAQQAAVYRAALETLWSEGNERLLRSYGETRAVAFARLAAGEV